MFYGVLIYRLSSREACLDGEMDYVANRSREKNCYSSLNGVELVKSEALGLGPLGGCETDEYDVCAQLYAEVGSNVASTPQSGVSQVVLDLGVEQ